MDTRYTINTRRLLDAGVENWSYCCYERAVYQLGSLSRFNSRQANDELRAAIRAYLAAFEPSFNEADRPDQATTDQLYAWAHIAWDRSDNAHRAGDWELEEALSSKGSKLMAIARRRHAPNEVCNSCGRNETN